MFLFACDNKLHHFQDMLHQTASCNLNSCDWQWYLNWNEWQSSVTFYKVQPTVTARCRGQAASKAICILVTAQLDSCRMLIKHKVCLVNLIHIIVRTIQHLSVKSMQQKWPSVVLLQLLYCNCNQCCNCSAVRKIKLNSSAFIVPILTEIKISTLDTNYFNFAKM